MPDRKASHTAMATAHLRAAHQLFDAQPRILEDPVAVSLLRPAAVKRIKDAADRYHTSGARILRSHVVLRSRFAEDRLAAAVLRGVTQYVILGAGFDTFALRQPAWAKTLKILEVDHSGTQALKRSRLADAGLEMPENADFANIDFERESLRDGLLRHHLSLDAPTFFSWLGVTMYLEEDAIDVVLRSVASFPAGSEIVFTFVQPPESEVGSVDDSSSLLAQRVASVGEPFVSYFEPVALEAILRGIGFSKVEFLTPAKAEEQYFQQRPGDLPVPRLTDIVCAVR
jgi:methyltransferase (TIGR00027 family)